MAMANDYMTGVRQMDWTGIRRWTRFKVDVRLKLTYTKDGKQTIAYGQGSDVSEGGMAAYVPVELTKGDLVDLEATLPYVKLPIKMRAEVRNRNGFRYGVEYTRISDADKETLMRALKALSLTQ